MNNVSRRQHNHTNYPSCKELTECADIVCACAILKDRQSVFDEMLPVDDNECADNLNVYRRVVCKKMKVVQFYTSFIFFTICAISTVREIYHLHFEHRFF